MKQNGLGRADAKLASLLKSREDIEARITLAQNEREEEVIERLREAGVGWLSSAKLEELIENVRAAVPNQAEASDHHDPEDLVKVRVRLSANASPVNRGTLRAAGLRWSGKQGRYIGDVSEAVLATLMKRFKDRVEVVAAEGATGGASPSTAVPTVEAPSVVAEPAAEPEPAAPIEADQAPLPVPPSTAAPAVDGRPVAAAEPAPTSEPAAPREGFQPLPQASRLPPLFRPITKPSDG